MTAERAERRMAVVSPVFNDWVCANELSSRLSSLRDELPPLTLYLVDDGSTDPTVVDPSSWSGPLPVTVVHAGANLGHQRAIAIGLVEALGDPRNDLFVVIDADGEDDPRSMPDLLSKLSETSTREPAAVVAQRRGRTETVGFRTFYSLYKAGFRALTGRRLDFGNYSVLTRSAAERLVHMPELWNHYPAAIMRSRIPVTKVPTDRSHRFHGTSRMNFVSLVNHGLAAIAAFSDVVFARLLILVSLLSGLAITAGVTVLAIRLWSTVAIPGWATAALGFVLLALIQFLALLALVTFIQLSARSTIPVTPRQAAPNYVRTVETVTE